MHTHTHKHTQTNMHTTLIAHLSKILLWQFPQQKRDELSVIFSRRVQELMKAAFLPESQLPHRVCQRSARAKLSGHLAVGHAKKFYHMVEMLFFWEER
jgi:hypothetical protein